MMNHAESSHQRVFPLAAIVLSVLAFAGALFGSAHVASAQTYPNPQFQGPGQFCVDDAGYPSGANCTANDTRISGLTPSLDEVCTAVGDTATARFTANLVIGASTRYDLAMYIATNGGNAEIGNSCYKDVLQAVAAENAPGNPTNPDGTGLFKNEDGDLCGEANQTVGAVYKLQQTLQILCVDNNNDGVVDPISTCLSWANNAGQFACQGVTATVPGPGTSAKCNCENVAPNPPVLVYRGYDFGDLPDTFKTTKAQGGAQHAVQDTNNDGTPNVQGGVPAVWLGVSEDFGPSAETDGQPTISADGDDINQFFPGITPSDENGVQFPGPWYVNVPNGGRATVVVSASDPNACTGNKCYVGFWINWNGNSSFETAAYPTGEYYVQQVNVGTNNLTFPVPSTWASPLYVRFRLYYEPTGVQGTYQPTGLALNGEVEDYRVINSPLGIMLADFYADQVADHVVLTWETNTEIDNRGFNLYRGISAAGPDRQLNTTLIPSQSQGSPAGFIYTWDDYADLVPGTTYYYWLEDVDLSGAATMHGPVTVDFNGPTAVTVSSVDANPAATGFAVPFAATLAALLAPLAGAVAVRRRRSS